MKPELHHITLAQCNIMSTFVHIRHKVLNEQWDHVYLLRLLAASCFKYTYCANILLYPLDFSPQSHYTPFLPTLSVCLSLNSLLVFGDTI